MIGDIVGFIGSDIAVRAGQAWHDALTWLLTALSKRSHGGASSEWTLLCPDVTTKIYEHLSLADHARISHLSHEFCAASRVREAAAQERLLARSKTACSKSFLEGIGRAIQSCEKTYLKCGITITDYYEFEDGEQIPQDYKINRNFDFRQPVSALNIWSWPIGPKKLQLSFDRDRVVNLVVARCVSYKISTLRAESWKKRIWGYITILWLSPNAAPIVWLWVEPQHAKAMFSLLGCACVDGMPSHDINAHMPRISFPSSQTWVRWLLRTNTQTPAHSPPPSQTSVRGVRQLLRVVIPPPSQRGEGAGEFEDEVLAGVSLLHRYLGNLRIVGPHSPGWVVRGLRFLIFLVEWNPVLVGYYLWVLSIFFSGFAIFCLGCVAMLVPVLCVWGLCIALRRVMEGVFNVIINCIALVYILL